MTILIEPSEVFAVANRYEVAYRLYQGLQLSHSDPRKSLDLAEMSQIVTAIIYDASGDTSYTGDEYMADVAVTVAVHTLIERATGFSRAEDIKDALYYCSVIGDVADESEEEDV
jgi:hypothetical protein